MKKLICVLGITACVFALSTIMTAQSPGTAQTRAGAYCKSDDYQQQVHSARPGCPDCPPVAEVLQTVHGYNLPLDLSVDPGLTLDSSTRGTYQRLAAILHGSTTVPDDRMFYYSSCVSSPTETILGWNSYLENVQPNSEGDLVTISVTPAITSSRYGAFALIIGARYLEIYQITNGQATFVQSQDPEGSAGRSFSFLGL